MNQARGHPVAALFAACALAVAAAPALGVPRQGAPSPERTVLSGKVELSRLVDLSAARLKLDIDYDPATLRGSMTFRSTTGLTDDELWELTQRVLATNGFTTVIQPGSDTMSIVKLAEAPALARLEQGPGAAPDAVAGFSTVLVKVSHGVPADIVKNVRPLLSKPAGTIAEFGADDLLLLSDLKPRIEQALAVIEMLDKPADVPPITRVDVTYLAPIQLVAAVLSTVTARDAITGRASKGKLLPTVDGAAVLLIAPVSEQQSWLELIERFDRRQEVETRSYTPRQFDLEEVSGLIDQAARDEGPRGSGGQWKIVRDELTGTMVITATPDEHRRIQDLLGRLDEVPAGARKAVRSYKVRNRPVGEIIEVLQSLLEEGMLEPTEGGTGGTGGAAGEMATTNTPDYSAEQRSPRENLPFASRDLVLSTQPGTAPGAPGATSVPGPPAAPADAARPSGAPARDGNGGAGKPQVTLTADEPTNTLIAMGPTRTLAQIERIIAELDVRQPQVMLEVLMIALNDSDMLDLGVELDSIIISGSTIISLSSLFGLTPRIAGPGAGGGAGAPETDSAGQGFTGIVLSPGDFNVVIRALQALNQGRSLVMPKVLVNNNELASLDSVLQQPFQSTNASTTVATTSFGGTQDAGTTVSVTPSIAEGDHLVLEYNVTRSAFVGESADPALPPPRQQNSFESKITIPDNYTVVIGGLQNEDKTEAVSQVPFLGDIPLLGEVFKNRSKTMTRTYFYVFIRATILRHESFEDLKYISDRDLVKVKLDDGWPTLEPGLIK